MLDMAVQFLKEELDTYLVSRTGSNAVEVKLSKVVDEVGKYEFDEGAIGATIINIEEERTLKSHLPEYTYVNGQHVVLEPDLKLNLHVLFTAHFKLYDQALKYLSYVLTFFQSHSFFNSSEYPGLDPRVGKLTVELHTLNYEQLNQIWAFIGGKHLPSVIYKVRMIIVQDESEKKVQLPLTNIQTNLQSR